MEIVKVENDFDSLTTFDGKSKDSLTAKECKELLKKLCNCVKNVDADYFLEIVSDLVLDLYGDVEINSEPYSYKAVYTLKMK